MQGMRSLPGVLYAEDFDLPSDHPRAQAVASAQAAAPPASLAEPIVLEPTFSLVDLQTASRNAHEEGRSQEREEFTIGLDARKADALAAIGDALRQTRADCSRIANAEATNLCRAVLASVAAILPVLAATHGFAEATGLLAILLPAMDGEPKLQIRANPVLLEPLRNDLATLSVAGSVSLEWIAADAMEPGDICVKWQDGMMLRDTRALCAQVVDMLSGVLEQTASPSQEGRRS